MLIARLIPGRRRPAASRTVSRPIRPAVEPMERRELLASALTIGNPRVVEGTGGAGPAMSFTVSLLIPSTVPVTVSYNTADRTARAGSDYVAASGTLTFAPGELAKSVPVTIVPDALPEPTESFTMNLSNPINAILSGATGLGSIVDDDTAVAPALSVADVRMSRGLGGSRTMSFTIALNAAQAAPVTVTAATGNWSAVAGVDYAASTQVFTFAPGETSKTFSVTIYGTPTPVAEKKFLVRLSGTAAALARGTAAGTLVFGA
ncbi:Calx-beta domain-containing protein [Paludisphaera mucosa]|uniref:Calx-beta domain-containing protein n=1 Tax=Paludisphaera mucosa TaxID=3030827 RepID=A0ABT6FES1_9BACT|nr:Calx-beta domain-containing protein [Paludisphaera mucosa]MDG3006072.1 Calx-beta domain-containing protein [Paludisphaera mucosa]